jgi:PKD repeat protein
MKYKNLLLAIFVLAMVFQSIAQSFVSTEPQDKNVILEEFTGVKCPNCPQGHQVAAQILNDNPGRVWAISFHPYNSSYTLPYAGDPDFRRHHPDSLYMTPYCGSSRFMPSAFINRRTYAGEKIQSRTVWANYTTQHLAEPSPVNVGLSTSYDEDTKQLEIMLEIYYTDNVTDENTINVLFTESGIIAQQSGGTTNYVHHHIFRETFTSQWGDIINEPTSQGSFIQKTYTFDNTAEEYNMEECEVIAYIVNSVSEEVVSGIGCHVGETTVTTSPEADFMVENEIVAVGESTTFTDMSSGYIDSWAWSFEGGDPATSDLQTPPPVFYNAAGTFEVTLTVTNSMGSSTETKTDYITVGLAPVAEFSFDMNSITGQTTLDFSDMSANDPTGWSWTFENGNPETSNEQNPMGISYTESGLFTISLTASNIFGTDDYSEEINVDILSGLIENAEQIFTIYPNPGNGNISIDLMNNRADEITIYNLQGSKIYNEKIGKTQILDLDLSQLNNGLYFIHISQGDKVFTQRLIISE